MAYGIEILNDSGFVQVGEDFPNLMVVASGTTTNGGIVNFPTGLSGSSIFVFAKPTDQTTTNGDGQTVVGHIDRVNGKFRLWRTGYVQNASPWYDNFVSCTPDETVGGIDYVVCTEPSLVADPTEPYGLEVYNAAGDITFHTSSAVMDITHIYQFETQASYQNPDTFSTTFTFTGGEDAEDYYCLVNAMSVYRAVTVGPSRLILRYSPSCVYNYTANTITLKLNQTSAGSNNSVPFNQWGESQRTLLLGKLSS